LRFAIEQQVPRIRDQLLCTLLFTMSNIVSAPGHFAQFFKPSSERVTKRLVATRNLDPKLVFYNLVTELFGTPRQQRSDNRVITGDALAFLRAISVSELSSNIDAIYADPPYTADHYSRYYHVLESVTAGRFEGQIDTIGRYPSERFVSGFSMRRRAHNEMKQLVSGVAKLSVPLFLSYSGRGLVRPQRVGEICRMYFSDVRKRNMKLRYSTQGRTNLGDDTNRVDSEEYLYVCRDPK